MSYIYGVFFADSNGKLWWNLNRNRKIAELRAKASDGEVYRVKYNRGDIWDALTFQKVGERIYP